MNYNIPAFDFQIPEGDTLEFEFGRIENMPGILKAEQLPHRHNFYEILWVAQGEGTQYMDFMKYNIEAPTVYFLSSEQVHYWHIKKAVKGYAFLFTAKFIMNNLHDAPLLEFPFFHSASHAPVLPLTNKVFLQEILELVKQIEKEYKGRGAMRETIVRCYLSIILAKFVAEFATQYGAQPNNKSEGFLRKLKLAINEHYQTKKSPAEYASELNVTPKYLTQLVKKLTGKTTTDLISDRVLLEAKRLLIHSDFSISEICYQLGFESPSYFGRFFRKFTKTSPGKFRELN